jgi:hypothetical protein
MFVAQFKPALLISKGTLKSDSFCSQRTKRADSSAQLANMQGLVFLFVL